MQSWRNALLLRSISKRIMNQFLSESTHTYPPFPTRIMDGNKRAKICKKLPFVKNNVQYLKQHKEFSIQHGIKLPKLFEQNFKSTLSPNEILKQKVHYRRAVELKGQTCLRNPAPNALVTLRRPLTLSFTIQLLSSGCSFLILITS